jgi:hypothetical protein
MLPVTAIICAFLFLNSVLVVWTLSPSGQRPAWYLEDPTSDTGICIYAYINTTYNASDGAVHSENKESGKFGESYVGSAYGVLIHVRSEEGKDPTACTPPLITDSTPDGKLPISEPWIALIKRGECDFGVKMKNAIDSNASAVIVYNDGEETDLDIMKILPAFSEYPYFVTMLSIFSILYSNRTLVNAHSFVTFFLLSRDKI